MQMPSRCQTCCIANISMQILKNIHKQRNRNEYLLIFGHFSFCRVSRSKELSTVKILLYANLFFSKKKSQPFCSVQQFVSSLQLNAHVKLHLMLAVIHHQMRSAWAWIRYANDNDDTKIDKRQPNIIIQSPRCCVCARAIVLTFWFLGFGQHQNRCNTCRLISFSITRHGNLSLWFLL